MNFVLYIPSTKFRWCVLLQWWYWFSGSSHIFQIFNQHPQAPYPGSLASMVFWKWGTEINLLIFLYYFLSFNIVFQSPRIFKKDFWVLPSTQPFPIAIKHSWLCMVTNLETSSLLSNSLRLENGSVYQDYQTDSRKPLRWKCSCQLLLYIIF